MPVPIPEEYTDLLERPVVAALATEMPDGQPQVTPVWVELRDGNIIVNTARGRQKDRNMHDRPRATLMLLDPDNPYRYLEIRASVVKETEDGARAHIDFLASRYLGADEYPFYGGETRVMYFLEPYHTTQQG